MKAEKKITTAWCVDGDRIIEENTDGTYGIIDWHRLTAERLKRLHHVLGEVLTDIAGSQVVASTADGKPCLADPPF